MTVIFVYSVFLVTVAAMAKMTVIYIKNVRPIPANVPRGIETLGFFRSPDMLAPANIPAVAGKKTPNTLAIDSFRKGFELPAAPEVKFGQRFSFNDFREMPVYCIVPPERFVRENGDIKQEDRGMDSEDTIRTKNNNPEARENAFDPTNEIMVTTNSISDAYISSHHPPCRQRSSQF
jgi:hypothetical protein